MTRLPRACALLLAFALVTGCAAGRAFQRGEDRAKVGDWDAAVTYYRQAMQAKPDRPEYRIALERAMDEEGVSHDKGEGVLPMKGSEDFGLFGRVAPVAMFFLGAGENHARLHNPDYDFPDDLIGIGAKVFMRAIRNELG